MGEAGASCSQHPRPVELGLTSYVTPLSVPASQGIRSCTTLWTQPHSLVHKSSAVRPTFQSGLGPSMVRKDVMWRFRSTENSAEGAARLGARERTGSVIFFIYFFSMYFLF